MKGGRYRVAGKRVLVTGASSGIGRALAIELGRRGAQLVLSARRTELLEQVATEVTREGGLAPVIAPADLSVPGQATELASIAGEVDVLVNNAGVGIAGTQWIVGDRDEARELFEINYWSALALVRSLVPDMRKRGSGLIVNIASLGTAVPLPLIGHYEASKAAIQLSSEVLRSELRGSGVRVLLVQPSFVDTPMIEPARTHRSLKRPLRLYRPVSAEGLARTTARALENGRRRVVYPGLFTPAATVPMIGRLAARIAADKHAADEQELIGSPNYVKAASQ
jgi:short-subunit dehydrogenase